jgi:hypothetical protein
MTTRRMASAVLGAAIVYGTVADRPVARPPLMLGGYRVLAGDFHVHPIPFSANTLAPWDLALEATRQGLDAIAMTPQNSVVMGRSAGWIGGAMVIPGEEIHGPRFHLIALGTRETISWRLSAAETIDEVHRQGGVAIAAHPSRSAWAAYAEATRRKLDGAEVRQPLAFTRARAVEMESFYAMAPTAAIGSSDHHGFGPLGVFRTYVFVREVSEAGVLEAIRAHRTVVVDGARVFGDAALVGFAGELPRAPERPSRWGAVVGLVALGWVVKSSSPQSR